ncbi:MULTISPECIES: GPW/gp25 family protein [Lysobacter]|jgi:phage baseplate assembly protein W|uniref:GPW/gp25 family protein n=1 Tax=Lysobacter TaxID=68 RepID=UPI0004CFEDC4|nr:MULTISPECIES: GPW/gp25 family protein [Lysobacter]ALN62674.1 phage lysozyme family protein [Lysobacter antibioticus]
MHLDFPFHVDGRGRSAATDHAGHVRDMIEQLVFTQAGERVNRPDFGSGLLQLVFAGNSPELAATVQFTLQAALQRWLQDVIEVRALQVSAQDAALTVELSYVLLRTREEQSARFTRAI